jgi:hypothetical protein
VKHVATTLTEMSGQIANEDWPAFAAGSTRNPTPQGLHRLSFRTTPPTETNSRSESGILAGNASPANGWSIRRFDGVRS